MNIVKLIKKDNSTTNVKINNDVPFITFKALDKYPFINAGFSTKLGGVSKDHLSSMNLGFERGDDLSNVIKNHEIIAKAMGFDSDNIVVTHQTHTTNVLKVDESFRGTGITKDREYENIDGLITNVKDVVLATYFADCVPLFIVDPINKAIGMSHSGWKGTVGKMGKVTIDKMTEAYGTNPADVICCIGPSICQDCYEISADVANEFIKAFPDNVDDILIDKKDGHYQLDLWKCNELVFKEAGVLEENIHATDICTCCNLDTMFSHRGHHGMRGNMAGFLSLR